MSGPAQFVDSHPPDVIDRLLNSLRDAILVVQQEWERADELDSAVTCCE
ncbi:hypothetical protein [Haloquadratum walsbyi]|nr:hypothetical protein [Haloquadratum walsbyi]